jgi:hypothetical protein
VLQPLLLHLQQSFGVGCCAALLACYGSQACLQDALLLRLLL